MKTTEFTDAHMSELFADHALNGSYLWAEGMGWLKWSGARWEHVHISDVKECARQWVIENHQEIVNQYSALFSSGEKREAASILQETKGWQRFSAESRLAALVALAQGIVSVDPKCFDADPYALNCANGVVDLRTGEITKHDPNQMMTKITNVDYVPEAIHPDWTEALEAVPEDIRDWYCLRLGQGIIGQIPRDDLIMIQVGGGANGKSTLMSAVQATIGDYFLVVSPRALLGDAGSVPTELMDFQGVRFASLEELPEERQLPTTKVKIMAGTPTLVARRMRQDSVTFNATHTLFISTNYPPTVIETDTGTWRRLALVPFPYHFVANAEDIRSANDKLGDPTLRERLREDVGPREACLAWLISGAIKACADYGSFKTQPDRVTSATFEWRSSSDQVLGYIADRISFEPDSAVLVTELLEDFNDWLGPNQKGYGPRTFNPRFAGHELTTAHSVRKTTHRRAKARETLSRRYDGAPFPQGDGFKVWEGVAFRSRFSASAVSSTGSVTTVTSSLVEQPKHNTHSAYGTDRSVTSVTPHGEPPWFVEESETS